MITLLDRIARYASTHWRRSLAIAAVLVAALGALAGTVGGQFTDEFSVPGADSQRALDLLEERFPAAAELLAEAAPDLLPFTHFPKEHWRQLWSNNSLERLNKRSAAAPTSSASSPTAPPSSAWWERSWPSNTMSGPSPAGT